MIKSNRTQITLIKQILADQEKSANLRYQRTILFGEHSIQVKTSITSTGDNK